MDNVTVVSQKVTPVGTGSYPALNKVTNKMSNGETETRFAHRETNTINDDGRAFTGNYVAVGIAFALVGVALAVAAYKLILAPLVAALIAAF